MNKRFILGIDRAKMRLYDVEQEAQSNLTDSNQDVNIVSVKEDLSQKFAKLKI